MTLVFTDQLDRKIEIIFPPLRIISLVPSQTELLAELGLNAEVVGITKFCIHPESWFRNKTRVGGTKSIDIEKLRALKPDLIIANKEENDQEQIALLTAEFPVWISDVRTLEDALKMIMSISELTDRMEKGQQLKSRIQLVFAGISKIQPTATCAYFIWWNPLMTINADTFINDMLQRCGFDNVFRERSDSRYPEISHTDLVASNPEYIFLSSEPFPFGDKHLNHFQILFPNARVVQVDGETFSWYGSRLQYFRCPV